MDQSGERLVSFAWQKETLHIASNSFTLITRGPTRDQTVSHTLPMVLALLLLRCVLSSSSLPPLPSFYPLFPRVNKLPLQRLLEGLSHITEWTAREIAPDRQINATVGFVGWIDFSDNKVNSRCLKSASVDLTRLVQTRCS